MLVEERDYRIKPGRLAQFVATYEEHGLPVQKRHLDRFLGHFATEIGELHHMVAWWGYRGLDDRLRRRASMLADPAWNAYLAMVTEMVDTQNGRLLMPSGFSA